MTEIPREFEEVIDSLSISNPVIYDIGSRDAIEGLHLLDYAKGKELHIFEPNPSAIKLCKKNIREHNSTGKRIFFNEIALTNSIGTTTFYPVDVTHLDRKDIGLSSIFKVNPKYMNRRGNIAQDEITVDTTILDEYIKDHELPDIIWIDVEGAELLVLGSGIEALSNTKLIHIEVGFRPMHIGEGKALFWDIDTFMQTHGFKLHSFVGISKIKSFLARNRLMLRLPWRWNAIYVLK